MGFNQNTRRRGPIKIGGQDGAVLSNMVNVSDGSLSVNKYGMSHNTRWSVEEVIYVDKTYDIWEYLGRPIYFEVNIRAEDFYRVTMIGDKSWADQTESDRISASVFGHPNEIIFIYDEEFKSLLVEIPEDCPDGVNVSIFASGFIPDSQGVNQYRTKIDMDR